MQITFDNQAKIFLLNFTKWMLFGKGEKQKLLFQNYKRNLGARLLPW